MPTIRHILFSYDFSIQSRQMVPRVGALARSFGARLTLFSVLPPTFESVPAGMDPWLRLSDDPAEWRQALQSRLDQALIEDFAGLSVERLADSGDPPCEAQ